MARTFEDRPATREATPLMVGLVGPSSSGKTFSALRLAEGIQRVTGGDIYGLDSEARRMLHYADRFKFRHVPFGAPFGPLDYLAAIQYCVAKGARIILVDSMSHEHEGPGGVLEMHEAETKRLSALWKVKESVAQIAAWAKPKQERRRLINSLLQIPVHFIFCFRAKEKLKIVKGKDPEPLGFMPQAGEEFVYEMTLKCLLLPGANGFPTWKSDMPGERAMMKLPEQFRPIFANQAGTQLSQDVGQQLAEWAAGTSLPAASKKTDPLALVARFAACSDPATLRTLDEERGAVWVTCSKEQKAALKGAADAAKARVEQASRAAPADDGPPPDDNEPPPITDDDPSLAALDPV
jgi:hypothetical protein